MEAISEKVIHAREVEEIRTLKSRGPWRTKSQADLNVMFAIDFADVTRYFFSYEKDELACLPTGFDIRGFRMYVIRGIPSGTIGGTEFHRIREEVVFCLDGAVEWICEDLLGRKKEVLLTPNCGVWMPPLILHTYLAKKGGSDLLVLANTLFDPEDPRTQDTFSEADFRAIQKGFR